MDLPKCHEALAPAPLAALSALAASSCPKSRKVLRCRHVYVPPDSHHTFKRIAGREKKSVRSCPTLATLSKPVLKITNLQYPYK